MKNFIETPAIEKLRKYCEEQAKAARAKARYWEGMAEQGQTNPNDHWKEMVERDKQYEPGR